MRSLLVVLSFLICSAMVGPQLVHADATQIESTKIERMRALMGHDRIEQERGSTQTRSQATPPESESEGFGLWKLAQGLGLCLGVFFVGIHITKRFGGKAVAIGGRSIRIIERFGIGPKSSLMLAEVDGRRLLIGVASEQVTFYELSRLEELDDSLGDACVTVPNTLSSC